MTPHDLRAAVEQGEDDTVVVAFTDHYGRTLGKRFDADFFLESGVDDGTHACDYLLTVDMEMEPVSGYGYTSWDSGYGDFHPVPDLTTLRRAAWAERTAFVLCDICEGDDNALVEVAPRSLLRKQVDRVTAMGLTAKAASELEFFLYEDTYREAHESGYSNLRPVGWYNEDYHVLQGARAEPYVGAARRMLQASGIPVENSKGEAALGQHELNVRYGEVLQMADRHTTMKQAMKELADSQGVSITFMAKPTAAATSRTNRLTVSPARLRP